MDGHTDLYESDFAAWALTQAARLREASGQGWNIPIDWEGVAEEIEGLARRDELQLPTRLTRIIEQILKLQCTVADAPSRGWRNTILEQRIRVAALLEQSPSLRRKLPEVLPKADRDAVRLVRAALEDRLRRHRAREADTILGQRTEALSADQVIGEWLPERPAG